MKQLKGKKSMNRVDRIYDKDSSIKAFAKNYLEYVGEVLKKISLDEIESFVNILLSARQSNSSIYFIGNGGSAATASHFANDIAIGTRSWDKPFCVQSLCDNNAVITAIANDDGYEKIFSQQLKVLLKKGDVVVAISASGNSPNLLTAIEVAKQKNATTVGLTAFDGGKLRKIVDVSVHIPTEQKEYGPAEDGHMVLDHLVGNFLMRYVQDHLNE
jgi:D-sedoheptulose 7-phosphate isomerase